MRIAPVLSPSLLGLGVALIVSFMSGCGGGNVPIGSGQGLSGNTSVTLLATSTANNQLSKFILGVNGITLTSQEGKAIALLPAPMAVEFTHLNGQIEPLATVSVPQGAYTSAVASIGGSSFTCVSLNPATGDIVPNQLAYDETLPSEVSVNLPAPITISGTSMSLSLDLLVSESASFTSCAGSTYSITPTFSLSPANSSAQPTEGANGKVTGLIGMIGSVDAGGSGLSINAVATYFDEAPVSGPIWQVTTGKSTVYQGIAGSAQLSAGTPVDMDATIQSDGSPLATRIAVYDTSTADLTVSQGPVLYSNEYEPMLVAFGAQGQGPLSGLNAADYDFNGTVFQVSGQITNLQSLPFVASFSATNMVAGQNGFLTTHALSVPGGFPYTQAKTVTLLPQAINGTVSATSSSGGFTTYTVTLANYDLFADLAVQPGQATLLNNPNNVVVYVDSNTQLLNSSPISVGGIFRFYGLVFNDNGTLRMDCAQINDGVAE
ncbi:MAG: hypothetical protein ABR956_09480 [Terracidiphilus sp.]|jgi:hypothetical protein